MKSFIFAAVMIMAMGMAAAQGVNITVPEGNVTVTLSDEPYKIIPTQGGVMERILQRLGELDKYYLSRFQDPDDQRTIKQVMQSIYGLLALLPIDPDAPATGSNPSQMPDINININPPAVPGSEAVTVSARRMMTDVEFRELVTTIERSSFADDRLRTLELAAKNTSFTVSQIVRIIGLFTFADDKLKSLRIAYPGCADPQNNFRIPEAFLFSDDKDTARKIISGE